MATLAKRTFSISLPQKHRPRNFWRRQAFSYLFILPALLIFSLATLNPIVTTIAYSFQTVNLAKPAVWIGNLNYVRMFSNPLFYTAWKNVIAFMLISLVLGFMVPVFLALMVNEMRHLGHFFRTIVYLPTLIPVAVALLVWRQIYAPDGGILNSLFQSVGLAPRLWLQNPDLAKPAIVVIMTWLGAGGSMLIYLSALQEIPPEIYEATELDGWSVWQRIWHITLPLIGERMQIMLLLQIIAVGQLFTEPFILTAGGPANSTVTPVLELYRTAFERNDFGLASAWSVSLLIVLSSFSIVYVWLSLRRESNKY